MRVVCCFIVVLSVFSPVRLSAWTGSVCGPFVLEGPDSITFTKNEKVLICGSKDVAEWNQLSESQSLFHLKTFLEERGYFNVVTALENGKTVIRVREKTRVGAWDLRDEGRLEKGRFRLIEGEPLTPALLDSVNERIKLALENNSFACPVVKSEASAVKGTLTTTVQPVTKKKITAVIREKIEDMDAESLRRYDAFTIGGDFKRDNLRLTENRFAADTILQNIHFENSCQGNEVKLVEKSVAGPPRLFVFGIGVNTEKGPSAKVTWKHSRLGSYGSNVALSLTGSFKEQRFDAISDWYFPEPLYRFHLNPALMVTHKSENTFERYEGQLRLTPATSWDGDTFGIKALFGPTLNSEWKVSGAGPKDSQFVAFNSHVQLMQHSFELNQTSPREGFQADLSTMSAFKSVLSEFSATKVEMHFTQLWNVNQWDPPALVLGVRGGAATTLTDESLASTSVLPSSFRLFLGGSQDLRGFTHAEIPSNLGALTMVWLSGEARFLSILPWNLQPFLFSDAGKVGERKLELNNVTYWSPGFGMRWESPIGSFRGSLARGMVHTGNNNTSENWKLYLSYGEEF